MGDSGPSGTVVFKEVGNLGVQVELQVSSLPGKYGPEYYAQIHEGECVDLEGKTRGREDEHEHKHEHGAVGHPLALVRLDGLVAKVSEYAHGGDDGNRPSDELPGNIDQPVTLVRSADGTASVTSLLEGVTPERVFSGEPKYIDLHAADSEDAPPTLACADLRNLSHDHDTGHG